MTIPPIPATLSLIWSRIAVLERRLRTFIVADEQPTAHESCGLTKEFTRFIASANNFSRSEEADGQAPLSSRMARAMPQPRPAWFFAPSLLLFTWLTGLRSVAVVSCGGYLQAATW
jgi:hypothetical protein